MSDSQEAVPTADLALETVKLSAFFFQLQTGISGQFDSEASALWPRIEAVGHALRDDEGEATAFEEHVCDLADRVPSQIAELARTSAPRGRVQPVLPAEYFEVPSINGDSGLGTFLLHDTMALDLTLYLGYNNSDVSLNDLAKLNPAERLLPSAMKASIGQSLLLTLSPTDTFSPHVEEDGERFAKACASRVVGLTEERVPRSLGVGRLLGGPLYEFELPDAGQDESVDAPLPCHLLVWFLTSDKSRDMEADTEKENYYYYPFLELLTSRAKILYARSRASAIYGEGQARQNVIQAQAHAVGRISGDEEAQLEALESALKAFPQETIPQSRRLQAIHNQKATIRANRINYRSSLKRLEAAAIEGDDLHIFYAFDEEDAEHAERQVASYLDYLKPSESFADRIIAHIQAQTNVLARRQMQRTEEQERNLERTISGVIAFFGIALTISTITATVGEAPVEWLLKEMGFRKFGADELWLSLSETFVHFLVGVVLSGLIFVPGWKVFQWIQGNRDSPSDGFAAGGRSGASSPDAQPSDAANPDALGEETLDTKPV